MHSGGERSVEPVSHEFLLTLGNVNRSRKVCRVQLYVGFASPEQGWQADEGIQPPGCPSVLALARTYSPTLSHLGHDPLGEDSGHLGQRIAENRVDTAPGSRFVCLHHETLDGAVHTRSHIRPDRFEERALRGPVGQGTGPRWMAIRTTRPRPGST